MYKDSPASPGRRETTPVRSPLGRDGGNCMTRMGPASGFGRPALKGSGMGSLGEGGSVGPGKTHYATSAFFNRNRQLAVLKIRVSMVRFRPWPPPPSF
jgi:hypothetical protein